MEFRELHADEIDVRVGQVSRTGASLLLYKDARVDMQILDETVGAENWQRDHFELKGNLFCKVGIKCGDVWVWKADCGTESNTEKEKGESSDSFKRACVNWGIGRELYTAPFLWYSCKPEEKGGKYYLGAEDKRKLFGAKVSRISYGVKDNGERYISALEIVDHERNIIFKGGK